MEKTNKQNMKSLKDKSKLILKLAILIGIIITLFNFIMTKEDKFPDSEGYIGKSAISIENGHMSPEALLSFGRLSDPQVSPDGKHILYGVSYTSISDNRSVRNLFVCNLDGSENFQLTTSGKSISNARWSTDGSHIYFLMQGQVWDCRISRNGSEWELSDFRQLTDIPGGISEFKLSPDQSRKIGRAHV